MNGGGISEYAIGQTVSLRGFMGGGKKNVWKIQDITPEFTTVINDEEMRVVDNNEVCPFVQPQQNQDVYFQNQYQDQSQNPYNQMFQIPMIKPEEKPAPVNVVVVTGDKNELNGLSNTIDKKDKIAFVLQRPVNELEERYIRYIHNHFPESVFEMNDNPLMDYNIMRNAKTLICSCSTFSWIAAFMGGENQVVYFPNYRSRWNHETFRKPTTEDLIVYYDFKRATEIELWTFLCKVKMD
jgi:hypothetical protein